MVHVHRAWSTSYLVRVCVVCVCVLGGGEGEEAEDSPMPMESVMGTAEVCFVLSAVDVIIGPP
jgi:hypothetical protein